MKYLLRFKRFRRWVLLRLYQSATAERERYHSAKAERERTLAEQER